MIISSSKVEHSGVSFLLLQLTDLHYQQQPSHDFRVVSSMHVSITVAIWDWKTYRVRCGVFIGHKTHVGHLNSVFPT